MSRKAKIVMVYLVGVRYTILMSSGTYWSARNLSRQEVGGSGMRGPLPRRRPSREGFGEALLVPQRPDRIHLGRAVCGPETEEHANDGTEYERDNHRFERHHRIPSSEA